jgi:hypothetical protein
LTLTSTSPNKIRVNQTLTNDGLFAWLDRLINMLDSSDKDDIPLYVDWSDAANYLHDEKVNLFDCLFEQPFGLNSYEGYSPIDPLSSGRGADSKKIWNHINEKYRMPFLKENGISHNYLITRMSRDKYSYLTNKYIKIKYATLNKAAEFYANNLTPRTLAVHIRGTDMQGKISFGHRATPPLFLFAKAIDRELKKGKYDCLFLCSDDQVRLDHLLLNYSPRRVRRNLGSNIKVVVDPFSKSSNGKPLHRQHQEEKSRIHLAENALVVSLLLSKSKYLIKHWSNVSNFALYFNAKLEYEDISESRYYHLWFNYYLIPRQACSQYLKVKFMSLKTKLKQVRDLFSRAN